jgi:hypothetical protein
LEKKKSENGTTQHTSWKSPIHSVSRL